MARILVIDDEQSYRSAMKRGLEEDGHVVRTACDGAAGLRALEGFEADVVVIDLYMPGKTGLATIRDLRRTDPDIPIVAISGAPVRGIGDLLELARMVGATTTLAKPFAADDLLLVIQELLGAKPA